MKFLELPNLQLIPNEENARKSRLATQNRGCECKCPCSTCPVVAAPYWTDIESGHFFVSRNWKEAGCGAEAAVTSDSNEKLWPR